MKGKKLFLLLLAACLVFAENLDCVRAEDLAAAADARIANATNADKTADAENDIKTDIESKSDSTDNTAKTDMELETASTDNTAKTDMKSEADNADNTVKTDMEAEDNTVNIFADAQEDEINLLGEEVANVTNTMLNSISYVLSATITQERAEQQEALAEKERIEKEKQQKSYTKEDLMYLACIIYCEAGNQSLKGKIAVANVVINRVESDIFDHVTSIKEAVYDCKRWGRQFSPVYVRSGGKWTTKGSAYEKALTMYRSGSYAKDWQKEQMEECSKAARLALEGKKVIGNFLYFNMGVKSTKAACQKKGAAYDIIGCHIFY